MVIYEINKESRKWLSDKWEWLKSFNKVPTVEITAETISLSEKTPKLIVIKGRVDVTITADTIYIPHEKV